MSKRYYIAYGSNLSVEQMADRCPDATVVGTAVLRGWQLLFKGCATIEPNPDRDTPVLIWEISERDEKRLDCYEGFPSYYHKKDLEVEVYPADGGESVKLTAMVYIMDEKRVCEMTSPFYYKVLRDGYEAFHFPMDTLERALSDSVGDNEAKRFLKSGGF